MSILGDLFEFPQPLGCLLVLVLVDDVGQNNLLWEFHRPRYFMTRHDEYGAGRGHMDERTLFASFWENESKTTRKVLSRIPEGSDYRPDPKSRTASEIAWQIVCEEKMIIDAVETGKAEWKPPPAPADVKALIEIYSKQSEEIVRRWKELPTARWEGTLEFFGGQRPAAPMAWSFLFDIVHHRGQISTYLRPMGSTVPQIYGPSADEP